MRYFQDEQALTFTVDASGAPGTQWSEARLGLIRPRLEWRIEQDHSKAGVLIPGVSPILDGQPSGEYDHD